jgi:hypothetical protein
VSARDGWARGSGGGAPGAPGRDGPDRERPLAGGGGPIAGRARRAAAPAARARGAAPAPAPAAPPARAGAPAARDRAARAAAAGGGGARNGGAAAAPRSPAPGLIAARAPRAQPAARAPPFRTLLPARMHAAPPPPAAPLPSPASATSPAATPPPRPRPPLHPLPQPLAQPPSSSLPPRPRSTDGDPFERDAAQKAESDAVFGAENTGINFDAYEDIPVETSGHDVPAHVETFEELDLGDALTSNIRRCKFTKPTPVQKYAIPIGLAGRDMMACAQTGSGKTAAFCFPIIAGLLKSGYQPTGRQRKVRAHGCMAAWGLEFGAKGLAWAVRLAPPRRCGAGLAVRSAPQRPAPLPARSPSPYPPALAPPAPPRPSPPRSCSRPPAS